MRTKHSFYNLLVSLIANIILPILGFVKVRLFISHYGTELNGLYILLMQVVTYVNICEVSFSLSFRQMLYKPLSDNDYDEVNRIYSSVAKIYRVVGIAVIIAGIIVALFVPNYSKASIPYLETVIYFILLCSPFGLSYFFLPPVIVLTADQKEYKAGIWIQTIAIIRMFLMIVVILLKWRFIWIFIIEGLQVLLSNIIASKIAKKNYPWLTLDRKAKSSEEFVSSSKFSIIQQLSKLAVTNIDTLVITRLLSLIQVSIYGSYNYLSEAVTKIVNAVVVAPMNSFGNLINSDEDSFPIFEEFYSMATYIATIVSICIFVALKEFIMVWINDADYVLGTFACLTFSICIYYMTQREAVIVLRDTKGLFKVAGNNAIALAIAKLILSIICVLKFGVAGAFIATILAYLIIDLPYNPNLVYKNIFNKPTAEYFKTFLSRIVIAVVIGFIAYTCYQANIIFIRESLIHLLIALVALGAFVVISTTLAYYLLLPSFRNLIKRFTRLIHRA